MRKNADVLIAWAQGKDVQFEDWGYTAVWHDYYVQLPPNVLDGRRWRIKPEPKPDDVRYIGIDWRVPRMEVNQICDDNSDGRWQYAIKLTRSGETGELTAEVVK